MRCAYTIALAAGLAGCIAQAAEPVQFPAGTGSGGGSVDYTPNYVKLLEVANADVWRAARGAETNVVSAFTVTAANTVVDDAGNATGISGVSGRTEMWYGGVAYGVTGVGNLAVTNDSAYRLSGDLTIRQISNFEDTVTSANKSAAEVSAAGETEATNFLYQLTHRPSGVVGYIHEHGAGVNDEVTWTVSPVEYDLLYLVLRREDNGDGTCDVALYTAVNGAASLTQVGTVASTTGTDNLDGTATITNPSGGTSTAFEAMEGDQVATHWLGIVNGVTADLAAENTIYQALINEALD